MLVLQINKGDADYFLEQILIDPITTIWNKTCRNGLYTFHMEQDLPMWWNRPYPCVGTEYGNTKLSVQQLKN
jgi:hypothetical protein